MTDQSVWNEVEVWLDSHLMEADPALESALAAAQEAGLPAINVTPSQGKFVYLLAKIHGARRILEIGTLGGYSTIWLARALPGDGHLTTIELNPNYAQIARANLDRAGLANQVHILVGRAADVLEGLVTSKQERFDFIFIDADKPSNPVYLERSLGLVRPGGVIVIDNIVRGGKVAEASNDAGGTGSRAVTEMIGRDKSLSATHLQTVGSKGYDGLLLVRVND